MTNLEHFIKTNIDWEEKLSSDPYNLHISKDNGYVLFKYDQIKSDFNNEIVREARGIIFRESDFECVCFPFLKFGNYMESYCPEIDWTTASVQEKVDGSLIKVWYDGIWNISTNGTIDAFKAEINNVKYNNFGQLVLDAIHNVFADEHGFFEKLNKNYTYMFELVSPYNRVVIPYEETKMYFLGGRDMETEKEFMSEDSEMSCFFDIPKRYNLNTLEDVINASSKLPWDEEGYVVCDRNFNRVKIKSPSYVQAHYARTNNVITKEHLIQIILDGEQNEFLIYASDYADELHKVEEAMNTIALNSMKALFEIHNYIPIDRKEYAQNVSKHSNYMKDFLFHCYNERIFWDYAKSWNTTKWIKAIEELER